MESHVGSHIKVEPSKSHNPQRLLALLPGPFRGVSSRLASSAEMLDRSLECQCHVPPGPFANMHRSEYESAEIAFLVTGSDQLQYRAQGRLV